MEEVADAFIERSERGGGNPEKEELGAGHHVDRGGCRVSHHLVRDVTVVLRSLRAQASLLLHKKKESLKIPLTCYRRGALPFALRFLNVLYKL